MNQAEVIAPEVQRNSGFQIGQFAREGQGETMKSSNLHPQRQILTFNKGRTDLTVVRDAQDFCNHRTGHLRRGITAWSWVGRSVKLSDLGIGGTIAEVPRNGRTIGPPGIGTDLRSAVNAAAQILDEVMRIDRIALAHMEGGNDLGNRIKRNVGVGIPKFRIGLSFAGLHDAFLLAHEGPNFIAFDGLTANAAHSFIHHLPTAGSYLYQELHDRFLVYAGHADKWSGSSSLR